MKEMNNTRRGFLRSSAGILALPFLESLVRGDEARQPPRKMIAICTDLGMIPEYFFPEEGGKDYKPSEYTSLLKRHREQFTVFSGLSHPDVVGGHLTDKCFLTAAPDPRKAGFKNTISVDQLASAHLGPVTRFPTLSLRVGPGGGSLSFSSDGVRIPSEVSPARVYRQLFVQGTADEVAAQVEMLKEGQSLMDGLSDKAIRLRKTVSKSDRERLDQFFTSFREMEQRLHAEEAWQRKPKPVMKDEEPAETFDPTQFIARLRNMYDIARLAVETDSTRLVTIFITQQFNPKVDLPGVDLPHHALTHQQKQEGPREQLKSVETAQLNELARMWDGLAECREGDRSCLDNTMVLHGSNLSNAGKHESVNLPILLAGGGFKHGQHLVHDREHNTPLANLYVSMLQQLGIETDSFGTSTGTLTGLEA